jgi:uroporphyrinogen decarboxylase
MTSKERVVAALQHREPDRVPSGENQVDGRLVERVLGRTVLYNMGWKELQAVWNGQRDDVVRDYCRVHVELPGALGMDYVRVPVVPAAREYRPPRMTGEYSWLDEAGEELHFNPESGSLILRSRYPEMSVEDLPDPDAPFKVDPSELEAVREVVRELGATHFIIGRTPVDGTFPWEHTVGMESFLIKMITEPIFVEKAAEVYVNRSIAYIRAMLEEGVDAVMTTDDYSDNRGPIMGLELFKRLVLPGIRRQVEAAHAMGGYFIKHTDGNVWQILDELVEAGIDGWHGIQRNIGMDLDRLKERYGKDLCFFGGVNTETLITGGPEEAREEVRSAIDQAAAGGGLVIACSNVVAPGSRLDSFLAMREAVRDYGHYRKAFGPQSDSDFNNAR